MSCQSAPVPPHTNTQRTLLPDSFGQGHRGPMIPYCLGAP
ncbi:unnamed protein product [Staurois parvus]|uniref:Uncharacterized protein n=1 Tax=Staurois parvus TaxID=386267 RepID=A0ABN9G394_9NEOB|nr:unnamed protein product [Staurois parvus]